MHRSYLRLLVCIALAGLASASGGAMAVPSVTVDADHTTAAPGDAVTVNFYAVLSGLPDTDLECITNVEWTWDDGMQDDCDSVPIYIPTDAADQAVYTATRTATVQFVSSCNPQPQSAQGSGTASVTVEVVSYCPLD